MDHARFDLAGFGGVSVDHREEEVDGDFAAETVFFGDRGEGDDVLGVFLPASRLK